MERTVDSLPELPTFLKEKLESGAPVEDIFLDREGRWFHEGVQFTNERIIDFFNSSVDITAEGILVIHYANFTYPIRVEDTAIFITGVRYEGFGSFEKVYINLSTGEEEELKVSTLHISDENVLYCLVRNETMRARFKRSPSFHILERLDERDGIYYLNLCGISLPLKRQQ